MITTLIGEPGDSERDKEVASGITDIEAFLQEQAGQSRIQHVGKGITTIVSGNYPVNSSTSSFIMPRTQHIRRIRPDFYGFN
jgi:hypothetical protein